MQSLKAEIEVRDQMILLLQTIRGGKRTELAAAASNMEMRLVRERTRLLQKMDAANGKYRKGTNGKIFSRRSGNPPPSGVGRRSRVSPR